jgi:hypothetical protein
MDWTKLLEGAAEIGGLLFVVYASGQGAKGAARWLKKRREARHRRLADQRGDQ